jgi:hypothetical protein
VPRWAIAADIKQQELAPLRDGALSEQARLHSRRPSFEASRTAKKNVVFSNHQARSALDFLT